MLNFSEIYFIIIFLQKSYNVGFRVFFDISLVVSRLRVINIDDWFNLPNWIDILNLSQNDLSASFLILEYRAEKVGSCWSMIENWSFIKLVWQNGDTLENISVNVS